MTLREAVEIMQQDIASQDTGTPTFYDDACKFLCEAGQRLITLRQDPRLSPAAPLPSETGGD